LFALLVSGLFALAYWANPTGFLKFDQSLVVAVTGAIGGFVYFLYAQHHQNTQLFVSLFDKFNERYNNLNEKLNAIVKRDQNLKLEEGEVDDLYDYFNLCAEEYLFYKAGYIDHEVWLAWVCGMAFFAKNSQIKNLWEKEIKLGSYYGFSLDLLNDCPKSD